MTSIVISSFLLVIWFSPFSVSETKYFDWKKHHWNGIVEISNTDVRFKCSSSFGEGYSDVLDIYTTDWDGFVNCNASVNHSNLIGSIKCGANGTTLDLDEDKGRSYFFIGFVRQKATPNKRVLSGGTCAVPHYGTKNQLHICDSAIPVIGKICDMSKCPLSLGVSDGSLLDRLISASSELDMKYSAKEGRISYRTDINRAWCAGPSTELASQYLQIDVLAIDLLSAVATQGAVEEKSWVNKYLIHYSLDGSDWIVLTDGKGEIKEFNGNNDERSIVRHWIKPFLKFRLVRFVPLSWVGLQCMRVEIHACRRDLSKSRDKIMKSLTKEPRPCAADNCSHLPHSMCLMYSGKLHCKCIQSCPREQAEVCGSDGKAYRNECDLKRTACVKKKKTEAVKPGPCQVSTVCDKKCVAPYSRCVIRGRKNQTCECIDQNCGQNTSRPVCGTDGKIYTSECLLKKTACENNTDISIVPYGHCLKSETERLTGGGTTTLCSANSCPPHAKCIPGKKGDKQCICPSCSHNGKKVCGSDGKTYRDVCELKKYSCKVNHFVKVMSHGECDEGKKNDKMSIRALLMFFIGLMVIIVVMGVVILINTFIFEPLRRGQISDFKKTASRPLKDSSFKLLHSKYKVSG